MIEPTRLYIFPPRMRDLCFKLPTPPAGAETHVYTAVAPLIIGDTWIAYKMPPLTLATIIYPSPLPWYRRLLRWLRGVA